MCIFGRAALSWTTRRITSPSRIAAPCGWRAAALTGNDAKGAWRIWRRDRRNHASPNSAQTESACAGALGVQLAGPATYFGRYYDKPTIGDAARPIEPEDILRANRMMRAAGVLGLMAAAGIRWILG
ncbi:MAG: cobalamin biosynthesis protein [Christensenellales bacterium]